MTDTVPEPGAVVSLSECDSEPALLVLAVDADSTGTLLPNLAQETVQRLVATGGDRDGQRELIQALANANEMMTVDVLPAEIGRHEESDIQGRAPVDGGDT